MNPSPVNPNATPEARDLLAWLYSIHGKWTLSGQHNQMPRMSVISEKVEKITGKYPLVWGGEWGFSDERNDTDDVKYRPQLLDQIREQHAAGRIVVLTWHQASPTVGEPCLFQGGVCLELTNDEWDAILTDGTPLHTVWQTETDRLAATLTQLQAENIPVIFRPYHEMNGDWFWWGGNPTRFLALWHMMYERLVHVHNLNHLLWAWCSDRPWDGVEAYFPGPETVDILGADIYPLSDNPVVFRPEWFDRMQTLAAGKPLALTENGVLPTPAELERQPWDWFMAWDGLVFSSNTEEQLREVYHAPRVLSERR